ncbi:MAG: tRNA lysidine(34) synthetase TilS [Legionellales bacterium]|nr:tRNA lysidine(34) synthetase TilS [Legionellales bacterium]HAV93389.1 tRNA lysidine(34) synthetase TilS [Pseudomonadota bacterium]
MSGTVKHHMPVLLVDDIIHKLADMFPGPVHFFCAWSGGVDSTSLLYIMRQFVIVDPRHQLTAVHVDHSIHPSSSLWSARCAELAGELGVDFVSHRVKVESERGGLEYHARELRYKIFAKLSSDLPRCLMLGHHADDQVETFFLKLLRGAGLSGLCSMRVFSKRNDLLVCRPLLCYHKTQLRGFLEQYGQPPVHDSSNDDTAHDRNYIRHMVLPQLASRWPTYASRVQSAVNALQSDWDYLYDHALKKISEISSTRFGLYCFDRVMFSEQSFSEQHLMIRAYLYSKQWFFPSREQMHHLVLELSSVKSMRYYYFQTHQFALVAYDDRVFIYPRGYFTQSPDSITLEVGDVTDYDIYCPNPCRVEVPMYPNSVGTIHIVFSRQKALQHISAHRLKRLYQSAKVPPFMRGYIPIVKPSDASPKLGSIIALA